MELWKLIKLQRELLQYIPHGHKIPEPAVPSVVAGMGIIEETLEYLGSIGFKSWRPNPLSEEEQLEELTDILFFYLELIAFSGFSSDQIERQYLKKYEVNLDRWRKAKEGDYSWDKRSEKDGL